MRVLLAGATGAIGRPLVERLVAAGHELTTISRSPERAAGIARPQVRSLVCDVFDRKRLHEVASETKPEVVLHEMTALPSRIRPKHINEDTAATNRLRTEGTKNLLSAALAVGAKRFIAQSIAFVTAPQGPSVLDETAPLFTHAPPVMADSIRAAADLERLVTSDPKIEGVVLRYGFFYGPGTSYAPGGSVLRDIERGRLPIVGGGTGVWSFVHVDDAAAATQRALERGRGVYNVTDDDPAPARDWITELAARRGKTPAKVPVWLGRLFAGPYGVYVMTELRGASNAKAKREFDWSPARPTWRGSLGT
jgi:nucleoside-diphosphate-sugar epimerase